MRYLILLVLVACGPEYALQVVEPIAYDQPCEPEGSVPCARYLHCQQVTATQFTCQK